MAPRVVVSLLSSKQEFQLAQAADAREAAVLGPSDEARRGESLGGFCGERPPESAIAVASEEIATAPASSESSTRRRPVQSCAICTTASGAAISKGKTNA